MARKRGTGRKSASKAKKNNTPEKQTVHVPLPSDVMYNIFSRIHILERIRLMTVCKYWYSDIRSFCAMQSVIGFRFTGMLMDPRQCHVRSHKIPDSETMDMQETFGRLMHSPEARNSFFQLFPNIRVIAASSVSRDFMNHYYKTLECVRVRAVSWTRAEPQTFERLTCLSIDEAANMRLCATTYPVLKFLATGRGIEPIVRSVPKNLKRLECTVKKIGKILNLGFASSLTHLRLDILLFDVKSDLKLPNLKSLILKDETYGNSMRTIEGLTKFLKVPKLRSLGLFSFAVWSSECLLTFMQSIPKLDALALNLSGNFQTGDQLQMIVRHQPNIRMFYWQEFPLEDDLLQQLSRLTSVRVFGTQKVFQEVPDADLVRFLQTPFAQQLNHLHGVSMWIRSYSSEPISPTVMQQIELLKEHNLKKFALLPGYLHDVFMDQLDALSVLS